MDHDHKVLFRCSGSLGTFGEIERSIVSIVFAPMGTPWEECRKIVRGNHGEGGYNWWIGSFANLRSMAARARKGMK